MAPDSLRVKTKMFTMAHKAPHYAVALSILCPHLSSPPHALLQTPWSNVSPSYFANMTGTILASRPLHRLTPLPRIFFPKVSTNIIPPSGLCSIKCHHLN